MYLASPRFLGRAYTGITMLEEGDDGKRGYGWVVVPQRSSTCGDFDCGFSGCDALILLRFLRCCSRVRIVSPRFPEIVCNLFSRFQGFCVVRILWLLASSDRSFVYPKFESLEGIGNFHGAGFLEMLEILNVSKVLKFVKPEIVETFLFFKWFFNGFKMLRPWILGNVEEFLNCWILDSMKNILESSEFWVFRNSWRSWISRNSEEFWRRLIS